MIRTRFVAPSAPWSTSRTRGRFLALIELARAKDASFLRELLFALAAIGGEREPRPGLFTVAQGHDQEPVRLAAQQALDELDAHSAPHPGLPQAVPPQEKHP